MIAIRSIYGIIGMKEHARADGKLCNLHSKMPGQAEEG